MSLNAILCEVVDNLAGAELAGVIGTDGLSVEMALASDELPYDRTAAEYELSAIAATAELASERLGSGVVRDLIIEADDLTYMASIIIPGYYAVLAIRPTGNLGRARFTLRQMVSRIQNEL